MKPKLIFYCEPHIRGPRLAILEILTICRRLGPLKISSTAPLFALMRPRPSRRPIRKSDRDWKWGGDIDILFLGCFFITVCFSMLVIMILGFFFFCFCFIHFLFNPSCCQPTELIFWAFFCLIHFPILLPPFQEERLTFDSQLANSEKFVTQKKK